jgi:O-antigen ligase
MEALAVIAGVVIVAWGAVVFLRGGLLGGCLAVLLAGTCFGLDFYKVELGPVPLTADRVLLALLVVQYFLWRRWGLTDPKPSGNPEIVLLLFLAYLLASAFVTVCQTGDAKPVGLVAFSYLMPAAVYWIARQTKWSEHAATVLLGSFVVFGIYLAITSLAEYYQAWWLVFPPYITDTALKHGEFVGRARGPLLHPIGNGILLATCLGSLLLWWQRIRGEVQFSGTARKPAPPRSAGRRGNWTSPLFLQLLAVAAVILALAALWATLTRSVWMGGVFAVALTVGLALPWHRRLPLLVGGLAVVALLAFTKWDDLVEFKRDKDLDADKTAESVELRPIMARVAWQMFRDRPLFGCGYDQYQTEHLNYVSDRSTDLPLERARGYIPHNVALSLLTETGLIGLGLFAGLLTLWVRDAWRLWRKESLPLSARQQGLLFLTALGAYLINGMFHDVSVVPMANMTLFFLAGATVAAKEGIRD